MSHTYTATRAGLWPVYPNGYGLHWSAGQVRTLSGAWLDVATGPVPDWLVPVVEEPPPAAPMGEPAPVEGE